MLGAAVARRNVVYRVIVIAIDNPWAGTSIATLFPSTHLQRTNHMADKTVTGKTSGVNSEIIDFLDLVAKHGGKDINILSGKRDASEQADEMYDYWDKTLNRGKIYIST